MTEGLYEILALIAKYIFAGLMALIVVRAGRITLVDSRRAKTLRRISPETGIVGELMVIEGDGKARRGMKYKVIREGQIGSARRADIRIRHGSLRRRHAYFLMTKGGLRIRAHAGAPLRDVNGMPVRELLMRDGDEIVIGRVQLMLILSQMPEGPRRPRRNARNDDRPEYDDGLFDTDDEFFTDDMPLDGAYDRALRDRSLRGRDPRSDISDIFETDAPRRRRLPFILEDEPLRSPRRETFRRTPSDAPRVEDNPLNRRRPRPPQGDEDLFGNDDEMW